MAHLSLRVSEELIEELDAEAESHGVQRSEYVRETLQDRHEAEDLRNENERLRNQLTAVNSRADDVGELVEYVEGERRMQRRREERQNAPVWRRAKWWVFGGPE